MPKSEKTNPPAEQPKTEAKSDELSPALIEKARAIVNGLKEKYKASSDISNPIPVAAQYAFDIWLACAKENPRTGAAQLESSGPEPAIEKYFRRKLFGK
ncbi:hypothetical protein M0R72_10765 [Candidatus Pacearchaeota archaeon]|nr:hypothetical protein [Candidatus Pacearchaeota archaeon]